jgi:2-polyprenyl-3-methyl-5-hydroxy-6-metoxy-1,4-benzoquinol methylase
VGFSFNCDQPFSETFEVTAATILAGQARELFPTGPFVLRTMQHLRPHICPFERVLEQVPSGARVLDIGCGGGLFLGLLTRAGRIREGVGFDSSAPAIDLAQGMAARLSPQARLKFHHLAVEEPWPDGLFDAVVLLDVLHHVPPSAQREVVAMAADRVVPGGRLIVKDMGQSSAPRAWANRLHDLLSARQWINYIDMVDVEMVARKHGLRATHRETLDVLWYRHELAVYDRAH